MINLKSVKGSRTTDLEVYFMKHENMGNTMSGGKKQNTEVDTQGVQLCKKYMCTEKE